MTVYISNAFSLNMLDGVKQTQSSKPFVAFLNQMRTKITTDGSEISVPWLPDAEGEIVSIVGHEQSAAIFSAILGKEVKFNRQTIVLSPGDTLIVGQYTGPRLPKGATTLPEGASIVWWRVCELSVND